MGWETALIGPAIGLIEGLVGGGLSVKLMRERQEVLNKMMEEYKSTWQTSNVENIARQQSLMAGYDTMSETLKGSGAQEAQDIRASSYRTMQSGQQDLVNRGLTGTTISSSMKQGVATQTNQEMARLNERIRAEQLGLQQAKLSAMERQPSTVMDPAIFLGMYQQYARTGAI